jgi:hypothetical protein
MVSNRRGGISGVSRASLRVGSGSISLSADFNTLHKFARMMGVLLLGMCLLLVIVFNALLPVMHWSRPIAHPRLWINVICLAPFVPWLFLMPVVSSATRRRVVRELDTFLNNLAVAS